MKTINSFYSGYEWEDLVDVVVVGRECGGAVIDPAMLVIRGKEGRGRGGEGVL